MNATMPQTAPHLLIINKNRHIVDFMKCKISINKITKRLNVITAEKKLALSFKRKFIYSRNILCALNSSNDTNYYFLILQSEETCTKIFNAVRKENEEEINAHSRYLYRKHIEKILRKASVKTKLVENIYEIVVNEKNELVLRENNNKRRLSDRDLDGENSSDGNMPKKPKNDGILMKKIYESPNFEKVMAERKGLMKPRLIIFPLDDKSYHFEYYYSKREQCYICCGCHMKVNVHQNETTNKEFAKLQTTSKKHFCKLRKFDQGKYTVDASTRIVESQNFKIIKYTQKGISTSKLFIFDPTNKKLCRGFYWENDNKYYLCIGCNCKAQRVFAKLCKNDDGLEYLLLSKNEHVCDLREFNEAKYKDDVIVKKPMYQHVECTVAGVTRKYLLIFTDKEKKLYYKFSYEHGYLPICTKCSSKSVHIPAYILTDANGEEYISVRDKKHVCKPVEYFPADFESNQILKPSRYQLIKRCWKGKYVEKLVVFDSTDSALCYEYTLQPSKTAIKRYKCNECHHRHNVCVIASLINHGKEDEYIELSKTQHKCSPVKFEDPNLSIIKAPNFKLIKSVKKGPSKKAKDHLIIYCSLQNEKLCYRYCSDSAGKHFNCLECDYKERKIISAKVFKDGNGEEFVQLGENKHVCKPLPEKEVLKKLSWFYNIIY